MPMIISHAAAGIVGGNIIRHDTMPLRFWVLSIICPMLPDADIIGLAYGIKYHHLLGHRGLSHSFIFAFLLGFLVTLIFFRSEKMFSLKWWKIFLYFSFITSTHSVLDALTNGGLGVAFFSPFDATRYFFPWTPIEVAPIGISKKLPYSVMLNEFYWIWLPSIFTVIFVKLFRKLLKSFHEHYR